MQSQTESIGASLDASATIWTEGTTRGQPTAALGAEAWISRISRFAGWLRLLYQPEPKNEGTYDHTDDQNSDGHQSNLKTT